MKRSAPMRRPRAGATAQRCPLTRRGRVGAQARKRRAAGGVLAIGRASATREQLRIERDAVKARAQGLCEVRYAGMTLHAGTDFAHVIARSQGGSDDRENALWLCRKCHRLMESSFAKGRLIVTRCTVNRVQGFDWEYVSAADKHAYRRGEFVVLAAGFVAA